MESSRSALAQVAIFSCLVALVVGSLSLRNPEASRIPTTNEATSPDNQAATNETNAPDAPLEPVATGLAQRTITLLAIKTIDFSPDGKQVAVGGGDGVVRVWEFDQQSLRLAEQVHNGWLFDLQFHPAGESLLTAGGDNLIKIWSFGKEWKARLLQGHTDDVHGVAFTPDGLKIVSGSDDTTVRIWDPETGQSQILGKHTKQVTDVAVHPAGHLAASSSRDGTIRLWDIDHNKSAGVLQGHTADVLAIAFSPDGSELASASYDKSVIVWDVASKQPVHTVRKHNDWVFCLAFSTDGKKLATGGGDRKIFVWNLEDGQLLQQLEQQTDVSAVEFSPDGKHFVAGLIDGYLQLYRTGDQLEHFGVIPPLGWKPYAPGIKTEALTLDEFIKLHTDLLNPQSRTWDASIGKLTVSGDSFTLQLLEQIDPRTLNAPKREMWTRARETLQLREQRESSTDRIELLEDRLRRAALAELQGTAFHADLKSWTFDTIGAHLSTPVRKELKHIYSATDVSNRDKSTSPELDRKVHTCIDELFKKFPVKQPPPDVKDPEKVEKFPRA